MSELSYPSRREFAAAAALLGLVGAAPAQPGKPTDPNAAAEALADLIRARFGGHLTQDQLKALQRSLAAAQVNAERMKRVKLSNADEPAFTFSADLP